MYLSKPYIERKVWGSDFLERVKGLSSDDQPVGETWEVSNLAKSSMVNDTKLSEQRELCGDLNYLVKFLSTSQNLSIQVHPNDDKAKELESLE